MSRKLYLLLIIVLYCLLFSIYFFPVLSHLNTRVYGLIGDNFWWFIWGFWSKNYHALGFSDLYHNALYGIGGFDHIYWNSTHPLSWGTMSEVIRFLPTNFAYNLCMLVTFPLAAFFAYLFFEYLTKNKFLSFCFGLIFSFSPYHLFSSQRHTELAITWVIPLVFYTFLKAYRERSFRNTLIASASLAITMLSSIYWGVYLGIATLCLFVATKLVSKTGLSRGNSRGSPELRFYLKYLVIFLLLTVPFLFPYIRSNYLQNRDTTRGWVYQNSTVVKRGLADFMLYSVMPYHFFIPPVSNPITGNLAKSTVSFIKENWGYFLAKNYVFSEHGGVFLGWANVILFVVATLCAGIRMCHSGKATAASRIYSRVIPALIPASGGKAGIHKCRFWTRFTRQNDYWVFALTGLFVYLFCMPPYFTISGFKIYTPAYLIYLFFPMLRTLSRMGVIIFLCVLSANAIFLAQISKLKGQRSKEAQNPKFQNNVLVILFTLFTLAEFYMPLKYVDDTKPKEAYAYLGVKENAVSVNYLFENGQRYTYDGPAFYVEYPWGYDVAAFYQKYTKKGFANPLFYTNPRYKFNAMEFSYELDSEGGIKKAYDLGVRYVMYNKGDENTIQRMERGENPYGFFVSHSKSFKDFGETVVFEL